MARSFSSGRFNGSSGSSGRSSFGGGLGGSSSGSSFGGGSRSIRPRGPIRINFFGSRVIVSTKSQSLIGVVLMFLIFAIFGCFAANFVRTDYKETISNGTEFLKIVEDDTNWFVNAKAEADQDDPNAAFYDRAIDGYYITYAKNIDDYVYDDPLIVNGVLYRCIEFDYDVLVYEQGTYKIKQRTASTYCTFDYYAVQDWDGKIVVAKKNGVWNALNYNYTLENNVEYQDVKSIVDEYENNIKTVNIIFAGTIILIVVFAALLVFVVYKAIKKGKEEYQKQQQLKDEEIAQAKAKTLEADRKARQIGRHCTYCGSAVPDGEENCPSCGASKFN